jgi:hypothetical protein
MLSYSGTWLEHYS